MNSGDVAAGILLLIIFLAGIMTGVIVIVSRASAREDRHHSVKGKPPDNACGGTRILVGFSSRDIDNHLPREGAFPTEWTVERPRPGRRDGR